MKTPPDRDELLNEILSPDELRAASLKKTLAATRRHRQLRHALRGASLVMLAGIMAAIVWHRQLSEPQSVIVSNSSMPAAPPAQMVPGTNIRLVNDEELLAMFPDRPVALVGPPQNRQFVFLDEERNSKSKAHPGSRGTGSNL